MRITLSLLGVGLAASVLAPSHFASAGEFLGCLGVESERLRLECYDGSAGRLTAELDASVAPAASDAPKGTEAAETEPENLFGKSAEDTSAIIAEAAGAEEFNEVVARVTRVVRDSRGRFLLVLDNQQRWRQVSSERFNIKAGDEIIIREAALGSLALQQRSGGRKTKVRRQD